MDKLNKVFKSFWQIATSFVFRFIIAVFLILTVAPVIFIMNSIFLLAVLLLVVFILLRFPAVKIEVKREKIKDV